MKTGRRRAQTSTSKKSKPEDSGKPACGLCGKRSRLTLTECCGNWICDDEDTYVLFSYARNSCYRNHSRHTLCGFHHAEQHRGDWKTCATCRKSLPAEIYVHSGTNEYNFEKLENPPPYEPTLCEGCGVVLRLAEGGYSMFGGKYWCMDCSDKRLAASRRHR